MESLVARVAHLKGSLQSFIYKLENEYDRLTWWADNKHLSTYIVSLSVLTPNPVFRPSVLDNFALLSGQLNTINKLLRNEKTPSYKSLVIIPLLLSPDRDEELAVSVLRQVYSSQVYLYSAHCYKASVREIKSIINKCKN